MSNEAVPFSLSEGLILEPEGHLLPWHAEVEQLFHIGVPQVRTTADVTFVAWQDHTVFGGIEADVMFRSDIRNVYWLEVRNKQEFSSATEAYEFVLPLLTARFGNPHNSVIDEGYPWVRWQYGSLRISLRVAERFTEYLSFMVSNGL